MAFSLKQEHLHLVRAIARRLRRELALPFDLDELEGAGMLGLAEAARRYDRGHGASFTTFAGYRIRGAMLDAVRASVRQARIRVLADPLSRGGVEELAIARQACRRLACAIDALPVRERHFIEQMYFEGKRLNESRGELGLSKSWASRIHARAVDRLREVLAA